MGKSAAFGALMWMSGMSLGCFSASETNKYSLLFLGVFLAIIAVSYYKRHIKAQDS